LCTKRETKRKNTATNDMDKAAGKSSLYLLWKPERQRNVISEKPLSVLWKLAVWVFAPCGCVMASRRFEESCCLQLLGYDSVRGLIMLRLKAVRIFETSGTNCPTTQHSPEDLPSHQHRGENLKSRFSTVTNIFLANCFIFLFYCVPWRCYRFSKK
jgi:hypothetical protein